MLSKKKKTIILSVMAVLLIVTGYLNITLNSKSITTGGGQNINAGNFFATYRQDRTNTRNQEIMYLEAIINSGSSSIEAKKVAEDKRITLVQSMEKELIMEGLIKAKGFDDVVVTSSTENLNVIVKSGELIASEVAQIVAIIKAQTGKSIENIKIIPIA